VTLTIVILRSFDEEL